MRLQIDIKKCYGCRRCEMACSFHHQRVFSPELSSLIVSVCNRTGKVEWAIDSTCDYCEGEERPLCVKYCPYGVLKEAK